MTRLIMSLLFFALGTVVFGHSKVNLTVPENEAILSAAPEIVELRFANKIRMIKIEMTHLEHPTVQLDLGDQKSFATEFEVPMIQMGGGEYVIQWRGLGIDGHVMNGEFMFVVE